MRVAAHDVPVDGPEFGPGGDAQLLVETGADRVVGLECLGLAAGRREGPDELGLEYLVQRMLGGGRWSMSRTDPGSPTAVAITAASFTAVRYSRSTATKYGCCAMCGRIPEAVGPGTGVTHG